MRTGTIRKAIAALAITAGSVVTFAGPALAATATTTTTSSSTNVCDTLYSYFEKDVNSAQTAYNAGNTLSMRDFLALAQNDLPAAQNYGCDWAARTTVPTLYPVRVTSTTYRAY